MENELQYIKSWDNARKYSFKHTIEVKENGVSKNSEVSFNLLISSQPTINTNSLCWKIERENFLLNGESPETPHMQMFIGAENSLFPLTFEISDQGKFLGISDFSKWKNKTYSKLEKLKTQFEGHCAEDFIQRFKEEIETETLLKNKIVGQTFFTILLNNFYSEINSESINWNILKIGNYKIEGHTIHKNITENLKEILFENVNSNIIITRPGNQPEKFELGFKFSHKFNPFSGQTQGKECNVFLKTKDARFSYQEKIKMEFQELRIEKSIPIREVKQKKSFFLSEKEEIKI